MQAEADKRGTVQHTRSGHTVTTYERPAVLQDECQPDWSAAPDDATAWEYLGYGGARWHTTKDGFFKVAPIFGQPYYGDMIFIKRP